MYDVSTIDSRHRFGICAHWTLDGTGSSPLIDAAVVIDNGIIIDVICPSSAIGPSTDFRLYHFPQATLLPGLMDCHVHLTINPEQADILEQLLCHSDEALLLRAADHARQALFAGVTTVRDLGARNDIAFHLKDAIEQRIILGPHLLVSGRPLTCPRGHGYFMGGEVANRDQMARMIRKQADLGADVVKVIASGGGLTPGSSLMSAQFSRDDLEFVVGESRRSQLPTAAHVGWAPVIQDCAEIGVDTLEHCTFVTPKGLLVDEGVLRVLERTDPYIVPTRYQFQVHKNAPDMTGSNLKLEVQRTPRELHEDSLTMLREFKSAGLRLAAGSDAGIRDVGFDSVIGELEVLVMAGYTPLEAVRTATANAAEALRVASDRGIIRTGHRADLLLVEGAVHQEISALRQPRLVIKDGCIVRDATNGNTGMRRPDTAAG